VVSYYGYDTGGAILARNLCVMLGMSIFYRFIALPALAYIKPTGEQFM
jgi:hypothetical protein